MLGLLGILKDPLGNLKSILIGVFIVAIITYCTTLWFKNSSLVAENEKNAVTLSSYTAANEAFEKQLAEERAAKQRVDDLLREAQKAREDVNPIYKERVVYVKEYRDNPNIPKCDLAPEWVSAHNKAATNPYVPETISASGLGSDTPGPRPTVDDGAALEKVNGNYAKYYELKHDYITLLKVCKGETATPVAKP